MKLMNEDRGRQDTRVDRSKQGQKKDRDEEINKKNVKTKSFRES